MYIWYGLFLWCRSAFSRFFVSATCSPFGLLMKPCKCLQESISIDLVIYSAPWWQDCSTVGSEAPAHWSDGPWGWLVLHSCHIVNHALTAAWRCCTTTVCWFCVGKEWQWNLQIPLHLIIHSLMIFKKHWRICTFIGNISVSILPKFASWVKIFTFRVIPEGLYSTS